MVSRAYLLGALMLAACGDGQPSPPDLSIPSDGVIPCVRASDCPPTLPMCHPDSHICIGCIDSFQTCGPNLTCDVATNTCVPADPNAPCHKNADCPRPGFDPADAISCEVDAGKCYVCTTNLDCVAPDTCHLDVHECIGPDGGI